MFEAVRFFLFSGFSTCWLPVDFFYFIFFSFLLFFVACLEEVVELKLDFNIKQAERGEDVGHGINISIYIYT